MIELFIIGTFLLLPITCFLLMWLSRKFALVGIMFLDNASEEEKHLRDQIPGLLYHWEEWNRLSNKIARQEWQNCKFIKPAEPIKAIIYRFIIPWVWKLKLKRCEQHKRDYYMLLKLHLIRDDEDSFVIHS